MVLHANPLRHAIVLRANLQLVSPNHKSAHLDTQGGHVYAGTVGDAKIHKMNQKGLVPPGSIGDQAGISRIFERQLATWACRSSFW